MLFHVTEAVVYLGGWFGVGFFLCVIVLGEAKIQAWVGSWTCDSLDAVIQICGRSAYFLEVPCASVGFDVNRYTLGLFLPGTCC